MKKTYIKNFYLRDKNALISISKCGHVSKEHLNNFIKDSRIKNYVRDNLVTKEIFNKLDGTTMEGYKLTKAGRAFIEKSYGFKDHQHAQSLNHDLGIANKYFSLSEAERETWRTETELRNEFEEQLNNLKYEDYERYEELREQLENKEISMPDGVYTTEQGVEIGFEVVTNNYGRAELEAKERYIEITKMEYETERR